MRFTRSRLVAVLLVAAMVIVPLVACSPDEGYEFKSKEYAAKVGEPVDLGLQEYDNQNHGCSCDPPDMTYLPARSVDYGVEPADGATVSSKGVFTATKPGSYVVTGYGKLGSASTTVVVTGEAGSESSDDVAKSEDVDTAEAVEVFGTHSDASVNAGDPPNPTVFELAQPTVITSIVTYHWNDAQGTSSPGKIGIVAEDGTKYGPWEVSETADGQGGVPNAYWYVKPNIELPAGTYTVTDSDPSTWSWNDETGGMGVVIMMGIPQD